MKPFLSAALLMATSLPAIAHPGAHDASGGLLAVTDHFLGSPFHIFLVTGAVAAAVAAGRVLKRSLAGRPVRTGRRD